MMPIAFLIPSPVAVRPVTIHRVKWCATLLFAVLASCVPAARGDDWPQWMGPARDGVWREAGIVKAIPPAGLPVKWRAEVKGGYSGPAVADGRIYLMD